MTVFHSCNKDAETLVWALYLDSRITPGCVQKTQNAVNLLLDGETPVCHVLESTNPAHVDFESVQPSVPALSKTAAFLEMESSEETDIRLGFKGDWWFGLYLNGEMICDCIESANGEAASIYGRSIKCHLKAGKNLFAIYLVSGSCSCSFDFGFLPNQIELPLEAQAEMLRYFYPPKHELWSNPWLTEPGSDQMNVCFAAKAPCGGILEYRKAGTTEFKKVEDAAWGQHRIGKTHHYFIPGLEAGTRYEYFLNVIWQDSPKVPSKFGPFHFKTFTKDMTKHSVAVFPDTHVRPPVLKEYVNFFAEKKIFGGNDILFHLGDNRYGYNDFGREYASSFMQALDPITKGEMPMMVVRGNHEYRGDDTIAFAELMGRPYDSLVMGDVFYLKLDSGWDVLASPERVQWRDAWESYIAEEKQWLEKTAASAEWKKARYHVVLTHASPGFDFSAEVSRAVRLLIGDLFLGENPRKKLDLWLCGHTHWAARFEPETQNFLVARPHKHKMYLDREKGMTLTMPEKPVSRDYVWGVDAFIPFPFVVGDALDAGCPAFSMFRIESDPNGMAIRHYSYTGELIDDLQINPDHSLTVRSTKLRPVAEMQATLK